MVNTMPNATSYSPEVKKGLIGLLMFTLYSDERTIYREYVQNALDSINNAVRLGVLSRPKDGHVNININTGKKVVTIKDNGTGIKLDSAVKTLLDISASTKDGVTQAGQFGIGRLVGGGYCHELIFRTSAQGEDKGTQIKFDVDRIWHMVKVDETEYLATEVIKECTKIETFQVDIEEHFFEVILKGIKEDSAPALLNVDDVVKYLTNIAPVDYKPEFKNQLIYKSTQTNKEFEVIHENIEKVQLFVNDKRVLKQYGLTVVGTRDQIDRLEYFKIEDEEFGLLGWGWFALTKFTIQIPSDDDLACIRLRKHNIQIGASDQLSTLWKEKRGNNYFYGEFFVIHPNIVPNAARDGLAPYRETNILLDKLRTYFDSLKTLYTRANEAKKSIDKIKEGLARMSKFGPNDYNARDLIENKGIAKFTNLVNKASFAPIKRMLDLYKPDFDEAKTSVEEARRNNQTSTTTPPKKEDTQPTVIAEPTGNTQPGEITQPTAIAEPTGNTQPGGNIESTVNTPPTGGINQPRGGVTPLSPVIPIQPKGKDIIAPLSEVLKPNEVFLIRRVFKVLNTYCPNNEHDQKLIMQLEQLIVKELGNAN